VLVTGFPNPAVLRALSEGVQLTDGMTAPAAVRRIEEERRGTWISVVIHEGRNRQLRRMLEAVGHPALALVRTRFGPISLDDLPLGATRRLSTGEVRRLYQDVGLAADGSELPDRGR
jgi:23S rRNA pseudouridine2605 synthase